MAEQAESLDGWTPPQGTHAPPILLGAPDPAKSDRWFRLSDLGDARTGLVDGLIADVIKTRGYRDGQSQGGGLSLLTSGAAMGLVLRVFEQRRVPILRPDGTWFEIATTGNARGVRVAVAEFDEPSVEALRESLRIALGPFYEVIRVRTRFPVVAQWAQLESHIAYSLLGNAATSQSEALEFMDGLFSDDDVMQRARPRIDWIESQGQAHASPTRRVCCYNFRGRSGHYCGQLCPLVPAEERAIEFRRALEEA